MDWDKGRCEMVLEWKRADREGEEGSGSSWRIDFWRDGLLEGLVDYLDLIGLFVQV